MALTTLIKPVGAMCNLRCRYCFYRPTEHTARRMTESDIDIMLTKLFAVEKDDLYITFQGGEPSMAGIKFYRYFSDKLNKLKGNCRVHISFQTNGTLIDSDYCRWFKENDVLVGVSLDGDRFINDRYRRSASGASSFAAVMKGIKLLDTYSVDYNILSVISSDLADNGDRALRFFDKMGWRYLQFTMPVREEYNADSLPSQDQMYNFLACSFDYYYRYIREGRYVSIRYFDNLVSMYMSGRCEQCGVNGRCGAYLLVDSDMSCYPCDFYAVEQYRLGSLRDESVSDMLSGDIMRSFLSRVTLPAECKCCEAYDLCRGGCPRYYEDGRHSYCQAISRFISDVRPKLGHIAEIIASGGLR